MDHRSLVITFGAFDDTLLSSLFNKFMNPPPSDIYEENLSQLRRLGALSEKDQCTELGRKLLTLPLDPQLGKLLMAADLIGVLDQALFILSNLEVGRLEKPS